MLRPSVSQQRRDQCHDQCHDQRRDRRRDPHRLASRNGSPAARPATRLPLPLPRRTVLASSILLGLSCMSGPGFGAEPEDATITGTNRPTAARQHYEIAPGPLDQTLNTFAGRAHVLLVTPPALARGRQSAGLRGDYSVDEGFTVLLAGSGLEARRGADGSYLLHAVADDSVGAIQGDALPLINVSAAVAATGLARPAQAGALGSRAVLDTPYSISVIDQEELADRQVTTLEQAFRYDASTTASNSEYARDASIMVRGLGISDSFGFKVDGLALPGWGNQLPLELFDSVELLKGSTAFMYGFGAPGGIVNYVSKRPTERTLFSADVGYKTDSLFSEHVDAGGRFGNDRMFGYRFNAIHEQGGTYTDDGRQRRDGVAAAFDARLTPDLTLTLDGLYAKRKTNRQMFWGYYLGSGLTLPATVDPSITAAPAGSYYETSTALFTAGLAWRISPQWRASIAYRYARQDFNYVYGDLAIEDAAGNYSASETAGRYGSINRQLNMQVEGEARTGALGHQLVFGANRYEIDSIGGRDGYWGQLGTGNIYRPSTLSVVSPYQGDQSTYTYNKIRQSSLFASDTVSLGRWSLIGGLRYTHFDQADYNGQGSQTNGYIRNPLSPTVALMFKPTPGTTLYASYVESLEQGGRASATAANANEVLGPRRSRQYELGFKAEQDRWAASAALFRLQQTAEYLDANNYYVQNGQTRYTGVDMAGRYRPATGLTIHGSLMYLQTSYIENTSNLDGKRTTGTPHWQAAARVIYDVPSIDALSLQAGGKFVGTSKLDTANTINLPSYFVMDLGAVYRLRLRQSEVTLSAQIQNLANRRFWFYNGDSYIQISAPRTLALNARIAF
ncbi:TonB-dependent siderophore receptor [Chitinasiproducens palmae]|uniref:Iron complex outermembrane recepter protein n=1 Tax=Chitinasiproducens palmae TaxID=1770053 RepID=A0A1H2PV39_9BURK|nr:TonB-dependent receptor [Chitinasiproducens palmae]SDV51143.1 iron complex outermembrane recepter protein [Chitinasiproducens palmae]